MHSTKYGGRSTFERHNLSFVFANRELHKGQNNRLRQQPARRRLMFKFGGSRASLFSSALVVADLARWQVTLWAHYFVTVGARTAPSRGDSVKDAHFGRPRGLVLDGCEHGGRVGAHRKRCLPILQAALGRNVRQVACR
jgi:hypothetical protein